MTNVFEEKFTDDGSELFWFALQFQNLTFGFVDGQASNLLMQLFKVKVKAASTQRPRTSAPSGHDKDASALEERLHALLGPDGDDDHHDHEVSSNVSLDDALLEELAAALMPDGDADDIAALAEQDNEASEQHIVKQFEASVVEQQAARTSSKIKRKRPSSSEPADDDEAEAVAEAMSLLVDAALASNPDLMPHEAEAEAKLTQELLDDSVFAEALHTASRSATAKLSPEGACIALKHWQTEFHLSTLALNERLAMLAHPCGHLGELALVWAFIN